MRKREREWMRYFEVEDGVDTVIETEREMEVGVGGGGGSEGSG
jgi:hypothetical protein